MLSGALSSEDEEAVEAELNELINIEHQKTIDMLPNVPSEDLPVAVPGNFQSNVYMLIIKISFNILETKEKLPTEKVALEAQ